MLSLNSTDHSKEQKKKKKTLFPPIDNSNFVSIINNRNSENYPESNKGKSYTDKNDKKKSNNSREDITSTTTTNGKLSKEGSKYSFQKKNSSISNHSNNEGGSKNASLTDKKATHDNRMNNKKSKKTNDQGGKGGKDKQGLNNINNNNNSYLNNDNINNNTSATTINMTNKSVDNKKKLISKHNKHDSENSDFLQTTNDANKKNIKRKTSNIQFSRNKVKSLKTNKQTNTYIKLNIHVLTYINKLFNIFNIYIFI